MNGCHTYPLVSNTRSRKAVQMGQTWSLEVVAVDGEVVVNLEVPDALTMDEARALAKQLQDVAT